MKQQAKRPNASPRHGAPDRQPDERCEVFALLAADHAKVHKLFEQFEAGNEGGSANLSSLRDQICNELDTHAQLEEEAFYPLLHEVAELRELVDAAQDEHAGIKKAIARLRDIAEDDELLVAATMDLMEEVEHHVEEEEETLFPAVERHMAAQLEELGARVRRHKQADSGGH